MTDDLFNEYTVLKCNVINDHLCTVSAVVQKNAIKTKLYIILKVILGLMCKKVKASGTGFVTNWFKM